MPAIRVKRDQFSGSKVFSRDNSLASVVRGLAIDNARIRLEVAAVTAFTDSSTGTAAAGYVDTPIAAGGVFNAVSAGGVLRSAFNTSVTKINAAHAVIGRQLNIARSRLGLVPVTGLSTGAIATAGTIAALDLTATTGAGALAVDYASYGTVTAILKANHRKVIAAAKEVFEALGMPSVANAVAGSYGSGSLLVAPGTVAVAATGASSVRLADGTAFLAAMANNIATIAAKWNSAMIGAGLTALTDSSGGTADPEGDLGLIASPAAAFTTAGTDCSPKAAFDTLLVVYRNTFASFAQRANLIAQEFGLPQLVDSTTGTASTTIAATAGALAAVTGTTVCIDVTSGNAALAAIKNNFATLAAFIDTYLSPAFEIAPLVDNTGGTADTSVPITLVAMPTTATGNDGTANATIADAVMDPILLAAQTNVATIAAKLNQMLGATADYKPLSVVAA